MTNEKPRKTQELPRSARQAINAVAFELARLDYPQIRDGLTHAVESAVAAGADWQSALHQARAAYAPKVPPVPLDHGAEVSP